MVMRSVILLFGLLVSASPVHADDFEAMMRTLNSRPAPPPAAAARTGSSAASAGQILGGAKTVYDVGKWAYENMKANDARVQAATDLYNRKKAAHDAALTDE